MENKHIIICVGRQLGSGGHDIARMLALDFNAKYYDRELLNLAAKESGFSEKFFEQNDEKKGFLKGLFNIGSPHVNSGSVYNSSISQESLFKFQSDAVIKAANQGSCVFVGRCADYVLRERTNMVSIFITASMKARATLFMKEKGVGYDEAVKRIEHIESRRASYYNYYTGKKWGCAASYDLCVDSSILGIEESTKLIAEFIRKRFSL